MPIFFTSDRMNLPIYIYSIGNNWYQSTVSRDAGFPYYHWLQTERGEGVIYVGGRSIILKQGCGIMLSPHIPHRYEPIAEEWQTSFVSFCGTLQNQLDLFSGQKPYLLAENSDSFSVSDWIDKIIYKFQKNIYDPEQISVECYKFWLGISRSQTLKKSNSQHKYKKYVEPVLAEISADYGDNITVQQLADKVYVTPQYLSRLFQKYLKTTTHEYLTDYRIKMAKEILLNSPDLSVRDVGILIGIPTTSHFISVFKARVGYTPHEFRNLH